MGLVVVLWVFGGGGGGGGLWRKRKRERERERVNINAICFCWCLRWVLWWFCGLVVGAHGGMCGSGGGL